MAQTPGAFIRTELTIRPPGAQNLVYTWELFQPQKEATLMTTIPAFLLQEDATTPLSPAATGALAGLGIGMFLVMMAVAVVFIIGYWKVFVKAGQPGWAILIPIYNIYILLKVAGRPGWWVLLFLIPFVNIVIMLLVAIDVAKSFGQSAVFGVVLLFLLSGIGYLVLGFGKYKYIGPAAATAGS
jgi:hypothetical protein